jgi:DNA-binding SARP family transcriptional activator/Flp pilus assembly protein TadD
VQACQLRILGGFSLVGPDGGALALPTRKDRLLLAYLALSGGRPQDRSRLAGLLWGDRGETQARDSLRQSLAALRQAFRVCGLEPLQAERETVTFTLGPLAVDAAGFADLADTAPSEAVAVYAGDLLEGVDGLTPEFEAWLLPERERLTGLAVRALEHLAQTAAGEAVCAQALRVGRRLLGQHATREPVVRALMRLLARNGDRSEALKLYATCRDALQRELGVAPDALTETLYRSVLTADALPSEQPAESSGLDQPALAVLPFRDLSGDGTLEALCDVLGEELVTGLGRFRELLVIERASTAAVAGGSNDTAEIGRKLGADLLVQGSAQRQGENLRITVRLVNAATRVQLWGEAFEQPLADLLSFPDRAIARIVATLHGRVEHSLQSERRARPNLSAYACLLKGVKHLRGYAPDDNAQAIALFDQAIALDPDYPLAKLYRAFADVVVHGYGASPQQVLDRAVAVGIRATAAAPDDGRGHFLLGMIYGVRGEVDLEAERYARAIALNPNDANAIAVSGLPLASRGRIDEAIERFRLAMRLNPHHPDWYWEDLGSVLYLAGNYSEAVEALRRVSRPTLVALPRLAAGLAQLDRMDEARVVAAEILRQKPDFAFSRVPLGAWDTKQAEHLRSGMRKAGLPE